MDALSAYVEKVDEKADVREESVIKQHEQSITALVGLV